jgi:glutamate decarboxylase
VAVHLSDAIAAMPEFSLVSDGRDLPVFAFQVSSTVENYTAYDVSRKLRERGWLVPAYTMPPNRQELVVLRIVVRNGFSHDMAELFLRDLVAACEWRNDLNGPMPAEKAPEAFHH